MKKKAAGLLAVALVLAGVGAGLGFAWPFGPGKGGLVLPRMVEIQEVRLGPRVAGRVKEVLVSESDEVKPGQDLVRLEVPELEAQRDALAARVLQAEADLEKAKNGPRQEEKLAAAQAALAARARWQRLKAGYREEEVRQARSELESARAEEQLAGEEFGRAARLLPKVAIGRNEYDAARSALEKSKGRVAGAKAKLDMLVAGVHPKEVEEAQAEYQRLEYQHKLLELGTRSEDLAEAEGRLAEARARLREVEAQVREATVRAPEEAVVEVVAVRAGDLAPANIPLIKVLRKADLWVKTYVAETDIGKVRLGQGVQVSVDSYPGRKFAGKVVQIGSESEFTPRNVQSVDDRRHQVFGVRVKVEDPQGVFKSGMAAEVTVPLHD